VKMRINWNLVVIVAATLTGLWWTLRAAERMAALPRVLTYQGAVEVQLRPMKAAPTVPVIHVPHEAPAARL